MFLSLLFNGIRKHCIFTKISYTYVIQILYNKELSNLYTLVRNHSLRTDILKDPMDQTVKIFDDYQEAKQLAAKLNTYTKDNLLWKVTSYC